MKSVPMPEGVWDYLTYPQGPGHGAVTTDDDGKIDAMILNDVTGDAHSYGYVLYSSQDEDDEASPSYRIDIGGTVAQVSGGNTWYNVYSGAACITKDADGSTSSMRRGS